MIILEPDEMYWILEGDGSGDLCAHGGVTFSIDGTMLVDDDATLSAAALYLLRTLESDHKTDDSFEDLFPCCGNGIYDVGELDVTIVGCRCGVNFEVLHEKKGVKIVGESGAFLVSESNWKFAALAFSEKVFSFYEASVPKLFHDDDEDKKGFLCFLREWERRFLAHEESSATRETIKTRFESYRLKLQV